jgi:hypothetical protein
MSKDRMEQKMKHGAFLSDLKAFAEKCIAADRYPNDYHPFRPARCPTCGVVPLALTIEHHTGSKKGDFKGVIFAQCSECGGEESIFSFTGQHRKRLRKEKPVCECGNTHFLVAICERIEGEEGLAGFFDEGVIVGQCSRCSRNRAFVYTD